MKVLICDLNISREGHNIGHIQFLIKNCVVSESSQVYFLLNSEARSLVDFSQARVPMSHFYFTEGDFNGSGLGVKLKFPHWKEIVRVASQLGVDRVFFMELTHYELQIGFRNYPFEIAGIEFRPSHRIVPSNRSFSVRWKSFLQKNKRRIFERIILLNSKVVSIYILNDRQGIDRLNRFYRTSVFKYLPDPIYNYPISVPDKSLSIQKGAGGKFNFLIFGALSWRKNIANIVEAIVSLPVDMQRKVRVLIVGKIPDNFRDQYESIISGATVVSSELEIVTVDEFVSDSHMEFYFENSDVSLMVYAKFYGSSGLMGRSAKYNLISLVPNVGLMADLCAQYNLGYCCDPDSVESIREAVRASLDDLENCRTYDGAKFYNDHSPRVFLERLVF